MVSDYQPLTEYLHKRVVLHCSVVPLLLFTLLTLNASNVPSELLLLAPVMNHEPYKVLQPFKMSKLYLIDWPKAIVIYKKELVRGIFFPQHY